MILVYKKWIILVLVILITNIFTGPLSAAEDVNYTIEPKDPKLVADRLSEATSQIAEILSGVVPLVGNIAISICIIVMFVMVFLFGVKIASRMLVSLGLILLGLLILFNIGPIIGLLKGIFA